jgi:hypothetical protein
MVTNHLGEYVDGERNFIDNLLSDVGRATTGDLAFIRLAIGFTRDLHSHRWSSFALEISDGVLSPHVVHFVKMFARNERVL